MLLHYCGCCKHVCLEGTSLARLAMCFRPRTGQYGDVVTTIPDVGFTGTGCPGVFRCGGEAVIKSFLYCKFLAYADVRTYARMLFPDLARSVYSYEQ